MGTAGSHRPVMPREVLRRVQPAAGMVVVDCTLGGGGHAELILPDLRPRGRLIALDRDRDELLSTARRLRGAGFGVDEFTVVHGDFADLADVLADLRVPRVDAVIVDLGISSMQAASAERGFSYKVPGPLDMRMDRTRGITASQLIEAWTQAELAEALQMNADEPHAALIAGLINQAPVPDTQTLERRVRLGLGAAVPTLSKSDVKMSVRRTFQALRIAVNAEFAALDRLLQQLPQVLNAGGRVVILTFHSGEDRRVKQAFRAGRRAGLYASIARTVTRSSKDETWTNRRASSAKLRWAVRAPG